MKNIDLERNMPMIPPTIAEVTVSILAETADYNHRLMNIPAAWRTTKGEGVKVAILDTGVPNHVDLRPAGGASFIKGYQEDLNGHATHCGGIIAATAFNDMGIRGIAPEVDDYYGAVLDANGAGSISTIIAGIRWAVDEIGADIISMSLGMPAGVPRVRELEAACQYAVDHGVAVFAAAGNEGSGVGQPAQYDSVYAVGAIDEHMDLASFSDRGKEVDFATGGVQVFSTYLHNTYAKLSGTSMACPALAAAAALILSDARKGANPRKLTPAELGEKLRKISFDIGPKGWDIYTGDGIPVFQTTGTPPPESRPVTTDRPWWYRFCPCRWF